MGTRLTTRDRWRWRRALVSRFPGCPCDALGRRNFSMVNVPFLRRLAYRGEGVYLPLLGSARRLKDCYCWHKAGCAIDKCRAAALPSRGVVNDYRGLGCRKDLFSSCCCRPCVLRIAGQPGVGPAGLVLFTFGNVSGIAREEGLVAIKPSGVPYDSMTPADLVVTDLAGKIVEGGMRPSSDLPTHLALYNAFPTIGGVAHTHSEYATAWAHAHRPIPFLGLRMLTIFMGRYR